MIAYRDSEDFELYVDLYFDAPKWFETASYASIGFTVDNHPFDIKQAGVYDKMIRAFHDNNTSSSLTDLNETAAFMEKFVNENAADQNRTRCIIIHGDRIVQAAVYKDGESTDSYSLSFTFEKYSEALTEATKNGSAREIPIAELPKNTVIYFPYPEIDDETGVVSVGKERYAVILPSDIILTPAAAD